LAATPPFLCARAEADGVRVVVRGDVRATAHGTDGSTHPLDAGRAATWHDDVVSDLAAISLDSGSGGSFTWIPTGSSPPPEPEGAPERAPGPERPQEPHTLDGGEFRKVVESLHEGRTERTVSVDRAVAPEPAPPVPEQPAASPPTPAPPTP